MSFIIVVDSFYLYNSYVNYNKYVDNNLFQKKASKVSFENAEQTDASKRL